MTTLHGRRQKEITLVDAIAACQKCFGLAEETTEEITGKTIEKATVGLFYSPESCFLSQVKGSAVTDSIGQPIKLDRVFEARIFNADYELRWLNQNSGKGIVVLLSEQPIKSYLTEAVQDLQAIDTQDQIYLLWGEGYSASLQTGWSRLATSRLGKLDVPIAEVNEQGQRVRLKAKEYFQVLDDLYGNVIVAEERLTGLQKVLG